MSLGVIIFISIAVNSVPCGKKTNCSCYYIQDQANVYNCTSSNMSILPGDDEIREHTNWLDFRNNKLANLCVSNKYLKNISNLILSNNDINYMCNSTINILRKGQLQALDLSYNKLKTLPKSIVNVSLSTELWLSHNTFTCDCDTLWLKDWMFNKSGRSIVQDLNDITCSNGGPMNQMDAVKLGCFPKELTLWQKMLIGISAFVIVGVVIAIIAVSRRWNEVKWFVYLHFDILDKNEGNDNLENKDTDVFVSYKYVATW